MPEYLAPGVFVEEMPNRVTRIEGVPTSTAAFVGPARFGPLARAPRVLTSLAEYERGHDPFGGGRDLQFADAGAAPNFMWHAARAFFEEGGKRLYVSRVFKGSAGDDGVARVDPAKTGGIRIRARHPGAVAGLRVRLSLKGGADMLVVAARGRVATLHAAADFDLVAVRSPHSADRLCIVHRQAKVPVWLLEPAGPDSRSTESRFELGALPAGSTVHAVTLEIGLGTADGAEAFATWSGLAIDPRHAASGRADSVFARFADPLPAESGDSADDMPPLVFSRDSATIVDAFDVVDALGLHLDSAATPAGSPVGGLHVDLLLAGGNDGLQPGAPEYAGGADADGGMRGLAQFEAIDEISLVAAPGSSWRESGTGDASLAEAVHDLLVAHAAAMRTRVALLDGPAGQSLAEVFAMRARLDSSYAALYTPWISVADPATGHRLDLPPSAFVAGICARTDVERGVWRAPANEVVRLAVGFETSLTQDQCDLLSAAGVNCFRTFAGRGLRLWGARTVSSDPEWRYLHVRRYFAYLEHALDKGTQWAVFEPNAEPLWARLRTAVEEFMFAEWRRGALVGDRAEKAFFVRCDRTTLTQNDLDNGQLICVVGAAPTKPAEFVIFRIGQWTADARS
jgi:phage tail sheath protein FI